MKCLTSETKKCIYTTISAKILIVSEVIKRKYQFHIWNQISCFYFEWCVPLWWYLKQKQAIFYTAIAHFYFVFSCWQSDTFWYCVHCCRPTAKLPMNMLGKSVQESSQNQPSVGSHSSRALLYAGTSSESVAASSSLDLDFLVGKAMKT